MPQANAIAPSAPTVHAWLSGQAYVVPGNTMPSSGATTWPMPCSGSPTSKRWKPWRSDAARIACANGAAFGLVASVRPGTVASA